MADSYENFNAVSMAATPRGPAVTTARALLKKYKSVGMTQAALARDAGMRDTTLSYYFTTYPREHFPTDEPWSNDLRRAFVARGCTPEEASELFGLQAVQDLRDIQNSVTELHKDVSALKQAVTELTEVVRKNNHHRRL